MTRLLVLGSGYRPTGEDVLQSLQAAGYEIVLLDSDDATWTEPYVVERVQTAFDPLAVLAAAIRLHRRYRFDGVMNYDPSSVELGAEVAEALGLRGLSQSAARRSRDRAATRAALEWAGVSSIRSAVVYGLAGALAAAEEIGYPVVIRSRTRSGSTKALRADSPGAVGARLAMAMSGRDSSSPGQDQFLVEECLDGPEFSVESVVHDGRVMVVGITRKLSGPACSNDAIGHVTRVAGARPDDERIIEAVDAAHGALGIRCGATHAEVRITADGVRVVDMSPHLAGDLIPRLVELATGIDMVAATAATACGRFRTVVPTRNRAAGISFSRDGFVVALGRDDDECIERFDSSEMVLERGVDVRPVTANHSLQQAS